MSSDEEFEKFLQGDSDDEQTALAKTKKKASKKKSSAAKGSSSKSKGKQDAKPVAPSLALDDSADPYNFDMAPPAFSRSSDDDDFQVKKAQKKKKDGDEKAPPPKKVSLEDRMADILKRHGSSMADTFAKPKEPDVVAPPEVKAPPPNEDDDHADAASEAAHSSSSDSLGMESADFEVGGYAKKAPPPPLKKPTAEVLDKAPFRVNEQLPQQLQQPDRFASAKASLLHDDEQDEDDDGYDDEFMDSSTAEAAAPVPTPPAAAPATAATSTPAPFKSEFEKMKELFSMPIEDRYDDNEQSQGDAYQGDDFEDEPSPVKAPPPPAAPVPTLENPMDKYDDDEFEDSDGPPPSPPPSPPQAPLSPGPPPPPPPLDPTSPVPALSLGEPKQSAVDAIVKATTPSFLDESFEFKYDLRSKVETISAPPDADDAPPPPPPHQPPPATAPIAAPVTSAPTSPPTDLSTKPNNEPYVNTAPPVYSSAGQVAPQVEATQSTTMPLTQLSTTATPSIAGPVAAIFQPRKEPIQVQPDVSDTKVNPIAAKFHSLQDQLNRSSIAPSSAVGSGSIDTSLAQAFERDKYILRAFSAKENEMKLQLQAAHREILSLRHQVEALATEQQVHTLSDARMLGKFVQPSGGVHMTNHAWDAMRKDIESQEALIQGYQVENERLMHQLREVRRDLQYDVHLNNQQLQATIKDLRHQLETSAQHPPAASHHLAAQLRADGRIIALEEELHHARQDHARRERELKFELDQVKKAKADLECRVAGVRMDTLHRENEAYEALKRQTDAKLADAHAQLESLQAKVDWYVQNQRFIDDQDEQVKQLRDTVATLQEQLADKTLSRPTPTNPKKPASRTSSAADKRRIQALEAQLKEMHTAMRKRHPDSLVNLILASKPTADELLAKEQHEQQLQQLKDQLADMEKQHEVKLTKFRQQHERVVQQLRDQAQATAKTPPDTSSDVAKVRLYYQSKIKELERKLEAKQAAKMEKGPRPAELQPATTPLSKASQDELEQRHREREASLQRQLDESENARRHLIEAFNSSNMAAAAVPSPTPPRGGKEQAEAPTHVHTALVSELEARNAQLEADLAQVHTAMAALTEAHKASLQHAKDVWQDELVHLSDKLSASQEECARLGQVAARVPILEGAVETLQAKLDIPNTPSMLQYQALEMQIHTLTQKHAIRETELQVLLQHATQNTKVEVMHMQQRHERAMALKCAEIATFQAQLDDMLAELKRLQQHP